MLDFDFTPAISTNDMMMLNARDLVGQVSIGCVRGAHQTVIRQEFQGAVNSRLGNAGQFLDGFFVYGGGGKMSPFVAKDM
jgi:hypothetical protein